MRTLVIIVVIVAILVGGGLLTNLLSQSNTANLPGVRVQTNNPDASALVMTPDKGLVYVVFLGWLLFGLPVPPFVLNELGLLPESLKNIMLAIPQMPGGLIPAILTFALLAWFFNKQVNRAKQLPSQAFSFSLNPRRPNSLGAALTQRPAITTAIVVGLIVVVGVIAAIVSGAFNPR